MSNEFENKENIYEEGTDTEITTVTEDEVEIASDPSDWKKKGLIGLGIGAAGVLVYKAVKPKLKKIAGKIGAKMASKNGYEVIKNYEIDVEDELETLEQTDEQSTSDNS